MNQLKKPKEILHDSHVHLNSQVKILIFTTTEIWKAQFFKNFDPLNIHFLKAYF